MHSPGLAIRLNMRGIRSALTFDVRGVRQQAKPDVARPLDGRVRGHCAHLCKMSLATTETAGVASHSSSLASSELSTAATPTPTEADAIDLTHTPRSDATALASAMMPPPAKAPATKTATGVRRLRNACMASLDEPLKATAEPTTMMTATNERTTANKTRAPTTSSSRFTRGWCGIAP